MRVVVRIEALPAKRNHIVERVDPAVDATEVRFIATAINRVGSGQPPDRDVEDRTADRQPCPRQSIFDQIAELGI